MGFVIFVSLDVSLFRHSSLSIQVKYWNYVGTNQGIYKVFQLTGFDMMTRLSLNGLNYVWPVIASPHIVMYV